MEINSASYGGHVVADLTVKAEIDGNWDPPGTAGHTNAPIRYDRTIRFHIVKY